MVADLPRSNEYDQTEIGIETVRQEEWNEYVPPGCGHRLLYTQDNEHCENQDAEQVKPYFEQCYANPLDDFLECKEHCEMLRMSVIYQEQVRVRFTHSSQSKVQLKIFVSSYC